MTVHLVIPGRPRPGERAGTTPDGRRYSQTNTRAVQSAVAEAWVYVNRRPKRIPGPIAVRVVAVYPRPRDHFRRGGGLSAAGLRADYPTSTRADLDNLAKPVLDGLSGLAWADDHQVCELSVAKVWDDGDGPRTDVWVSPMVAVQAVPA